jgi:hypothetical protein
MATPTMKSILDQTRQLIQTKQAEFNSNLAGGVKAAKGLDASGAGDDSEKTRGHALEADQAALEPQKKPAITADANAKPPSDGSGTTGKAEGKEESNVTDRSGTLEAGDPPPATVEHKPLITADANAKKAQDGAAKIANDILRSIRGVQTATPAPAPAKVAEVKKEEKPAAAKKQDVAPSAADTAAPVAAKEAAEPDMTLTGDVLQKIAAIVLSTEEGVEFVAQKLADAAGQEAALETLGFVAKQAELAEQQAEYARGAADAEALAQQAIYEQGILQGRKIAAAELLRKTGQAAADASIEDLMAQGGEAGGAPAGMPPEMAGGMPPEAAGAPGAEGEGSITPDELMAGLEAMVQEGTLKPEEAEAVLQYITQAGGGEGAPAEGAPAEGAPAPAGEGAAPAEAAAKPEEKKPEEDSSKEAQALLATIKQIRQAARR